MAVNCSLELGPCSSLGSPLHSPLDPTLAPGLMRVDSSPSLSSLPASAMETDANISLRNTTDAEVVLEGYLVLAAVSLVLALLILVTVVGKLHRSHSCCFVSVFQYQMTCV